MADEQELVGGNVSIGVVRVGDTVRRPASPWTPAVHALLLHLHEVGFAHSPRSFGLDDQGRHVLEYIPGEVAHPFRALGETRGAALHTIGSITRQLHDALESFVPPADAHWHNPIPSDAADLVVQNDLAPWNIAIHPCPHRDPPQPVPLKRPEHLTDLNHADLPEPHARQPPRQWT